ncbi:MAG: hypothetical protein DRH50_11505 [Deltaproteobacteria bacterium]|nr:MAG: hypothetical protein DRH50_11505 [Deltaproteobacteria bacterium]
MPSVEKGAATLKRKSRLLNLTRVINWFREAHNLLKRERFLHLLSVVFLFIIFGALAIFFSDNYYTTKGISGILDAIYWAVVTITTVGYGDIVPTSSLAKIAGLIIILSGPALLALVTASVASIYVERKIKEGKGLESIKDKDHIIICGWNENGEKVIDSIAAQMKAGQTSIVLVNELSRDEVQSIQYKYKDYNLRFVRGNFVREDVLARANIMNARSAIVMADVSGGHSIEKADQRTIFGTMTIKSMAPKVRTCAELIDGHNREHLVRTKVDEIIVRGESSGCMLAMAAIAPGVSSTIRSLISSEDENKIWRLPVPSRYVGKSFGELSAHLREKFSAIVLAVLREQKQMKLDDILSPDSTSIDEFIKRKFEESGKDFFGEKEKVSVVINPPDDYQLSKNHAIVVISKEKPEEAGFVERLVKGT